MFDTAQNNIDTKPKPLIKIFFIYTKEIVYVVSPFQLRETHAESLFRPTFLDPLKTKHHWPTDLQIRQDTLKHPQGQMEFCKQEKKTSEL